MAVNLYQQYREVSQTLEDIRIFRQSLRKRLQYKLLPATLRLVGKREARSAKF